LPSGSPTEDVEQIGLFELLEMQRCMWPELSLAYHVPNGGKRGKAEAGRLKAMGVKAGVPDVALPVPRRGYAGMYVEMKRTNGRDSDVRGNQKRWATDLREQGYYVVTAFGAVQAWEFIRWYIMGARTITIGVDDTGRMP
jgi:hypothetical protein